MKDLTPEERLIASTEDVNADPAKLAPVDTETTNEGVVCTVGIPRLPLARMPDGEDFVEMKLSVRAKTETDALRRLVQLLVERVEWTCQYFEEQGK